MPHIEMPEEYVGRPIEMPPDPVEMDPITREVQATLERLGMAPGYVTPEPALATGALRPVEDMSVPFSAEYRSVPLEEPGQQNRPDYAVPADLFGAERAAPEPSGPPYNAAPVDPSTVSRSLGGSKSDIEAEPAPQSVAKADEGFRKTFQDYIDSYQKSSDAQFAAQQAQGQRVVAAEERAVARMEQSNAEFRTRRELAHAAADQETAGWLREMDETSKKEPDASRYWESLPEFNKALWMLGIAFGAWSTAGNPNAKVFGLELLREQVARDVQLQRERITRQVETLRTKGQVMEARHARLLSDLADDRTAEFQRIQALEKAWVARATLPGDMEAAATKAAGMQFLAESKMRLAGEYRTEAVKRREAAAARSFQAAENEKNRNLQRELAEFEASMKTGPIPGFDKEGKPLYSVSVSGVDPNTGKPIRGLQAAKADGSPAISLQPGVPPGAIAFRDDKTRGDFDKSVHAANVQWHLLDDVSKRLSKMDQSRFEKAAQLGLGTVDPELNSALKELAYPTAKSLDPRGVVTNADFANALQVTLGQNPDGNWADRGKFVWKLEDIRGLVNKRISEFKERTQGQLSSDVDRAINPEAVGVLWNPMNLNAPKVPNPNATQRFGVPGASGAQLEKGERVLPSAVGGVKPSADEYRRRSAIEESDPARKLSQLPAHDAGPVQEVLDGAKGLSPENIRGMAATVLGRIQSGDKAQPVDENTRKIVTSVTDDLAKKAEAKVKRLESKVDHIATWKSRPSDDAVRGWVKEAGFTNAEDVAQHILDVYHAAQKKVDAKAAADPTRKVKERFRLPGLAR